MNSRRIGQRAILIVVIFSMALPSVVVANTGFSVSADRSGVPQGVSTVVRVTIRPDVQGDVDNRCYAFAIPAAFSVLGASVAARPDGSNWTAIMHAGGLQLRANGGSVIEDPEVLTAAITVYGNTPGAYSWTIGGYDSNTCQAGGLKEQRTIAMAVTGVPAPTPTPSPQPTPALTPRPTQQATPQPQPPASQGSAPASPPLQSPNATPPPAAGVSPGTSPSSRPQPSAGPEDDHPSGAGLDPLEGDSQGGAPQIAAGAGSELVTIPRSEGREESASVDAELASGVMSAMVMLDNPFEWFVPGATLGVPAIVILVILGLQLVAGFIWAPTVRRMTDDDRPRRRPLRPGWLSPTAE